MTLPLTALASLPGVSAGLAKHFRDPKHCASMAETITTDDPTTLGNTERIYDAMRFATDQVSLNGNDCANSVVNTGASLSMVDETYVDACGLTGTLEDIDLTYLMASGQSRRSGKILRNAQVQLGPLTFAVDLVVTTSPIFDLLLGNDLLSRASAEILVDQQVIRVSDLSHGQECTATLVLNVRTMTPSPADPPVPLQSPPPSAGRTPNVDPFMKKEQRSACPFSWLHSTAVPQCGYCHMPSERYQADTPTVPVQRQSEWALQDAEDERLLQGEDVTGALGKPCTWAVQHAGIGVPCPSTDITSAAPHFAAVCSMVVTDVPCATNPTSEQTTESMQNTSKTATRILRRGNTKAVMLRPLAQTGPALIVWKSKMTTRCTHLWKAAWREQVLDLRRTTKIFCPGLMNSTRIYMMVTCQKKAGAPL